MSKEIKVGDIKLTEAQIQSALKARAEGNPLYYGKGDTLLDFGAASSFLDENETGKRFSMRIVNAGDTDQKVQFNEIIADLENAEIIAEGALGDTDVTVTGTPRSVDILRNYVKQNPLRLRSIKLNVSDVAQLDEPIVFHTESPFGTMAEVQRIPSEYQDQNTNNPKMSEVSDIKDWCLSDKSTILYNIQAGKSVTLTFVFGASFDAAGALAKKAESAANTAALTYVAAKK